MSASDEPESGVTPGVDPPRMVDDSESPESLRAALAAARDDLPDGARIAAIAARLGPLLGPPGGGGSGGDGGGEPAPSPPVDVSAIPGLVQGGFWKVALVVAACAGAIVATSVAFRPSSEVAPREGPSAETTSAAPARASTDTPTSAAEPMPAPVPDTSASLPRPRREPPVRTPTEASRHEPPVVAPVVMTEPPPDPARELALIRDAQAALRSSPSRALELTEEHRRTFGSGPLSQEREVIAIDALVRMGSMDAARRRADGFRARYPSSAYVRRIDVLVPPAP